MSLAPRILPLAGIAIAGVLATKALSGAPALWGAAQAAPAAAAPAPAPAPARPAPPPVSRPAAPAPPAVCARTPADLAREAGLSPAELATLQNLGARRGQLDAREAALDGQLQLINAASLKLDAKLKGLHDLQAQIQGLLGQADSRSTSQVDQLVLVYEKMKPKDAGALMAALDDKVRVPVAAKIAETKPAVMAAILSQMGTSEGKKLTELLAHRFTPAQTLAQAMATPTPSAAPPASDATPATPATPKSAAPPRRPVRPKRGRASPQKVAAARRTPQLAAVTSPAASAASAASPGVIAPLKLAPAGAATPPAAPPAALKPAP